MVFTSQSRVAINNLKEALGIAVNASRLAVIP
jgi:polysaccharide export outer membrane protein